MHEIIIYFSAISFLGFGMASFLWPPMRKEYIRYGVSQFRPLVGSLQIMGALGLFAGFSFPLVGQLAAAGLSLLMFFGAYIRRRIKDSWLQTLPALSYLALNAYIAIAGFR